MRLTYISSNYKESVGKSALLVVISAVVGYTLAILAPSIASKASATVRKTLPPISLKKLAILSL